MNNSPLKRFRGLDVDPRFYWAYSVFFNGLWYLSIEFSEFMHFFLCLSQATHKIPLLVRLLYTASSSFIGVAWCLHRFIIIKKYFKLKIIAMFFSWFMIAACLKETSNAHVQSANGIDIICTHEPNWPGSKMTTRRNLWICWTHFMVNSQYQNKSPSIALLIATHTHTT